MSPAAERSDSEQRLPVLVTAVSGDLRCESKFIDDLVSLLFYTLFFRRIGFQGYPVEPEVSNRHPILGQGPGFVRADGGRGAKRLDGLQVLDKTVLLRHPLRAQREHYLSTQ